MNAGKGIFPFQDSGAGVWHVISRIIDRAYLLDDEAKCALQNKLSVY